MSEKNESEADKNSAFFHVSNKGIDNKIIFNDEEDYRVYLSYIEEYVTNPKDAHSLKKEFTINGQTFKGTPHQPKNYSKQIELVAYSQLPDHYHLLVHELEKGALERFIRSLCTRYAIYFNKKYNRRGAIFEGPYKSVEIKDMHTVYLLSRYFHKASKHSSYTAYLDNGKNWWGNPNIVLNHFEHKKGGYQYFIEEYQASDEDRKMLERVLFDRDVHHDIQQFDRVITQNHTPIVVKQVTRRPHAFLLLLISSTLYFGLISIGVENVQRVQANNLTSSESVLGQSVLPSIVPTVFPTTIPTDDTPIHSYVKVAVRESFKQVSIHHDPTNTAPIIAKAKNGDVFEFVSFDPNWFAIIMPDYTIGYISTNDVQVQIPTP